MRRMIIVLIVLIVLIASGCGEKDKQEDTVKAIEASTTVDYKSLKCRQIEDAQKEELTATIETNYGNIVITLFPKDAPLMVDK